MCYTLTTSRSTGSQLLLLLSCLQLTFADASSAIPATYIRSSVDSQDSSGLGGPSAKSLNPCVNVDTGCEVDPTAEYQFPRRLSFANQLLDKPSSYELQSLPDLVLPAEVNGGMRQLEKAPGYRERGTGSQVHRPAMDRPIWNVPFRVVHGSGRNVVKFGKRSSADGFDGYRFKFGKRPKEVEKRMFKLGKRLEGFSDDQSLSEDKRMFKFGKRVDDLQDDPNVETGEEKRMFKFGKRTDDWSGESKLPAEEEKRMFKFGKRFDRFSDEQNNSAGDEKRMFKFGKRSDYRQGDLNLEKEEEKRKFQFGKRSEYPQGDLNLEREEEKRKFPFGKRTHDIQVAPNLSSGDEARLLKFGEWSKSFPEAQKLDESEEEKRMIKFGKKSDEFNDENLQELEAETKGLFQFPEDEKRMFKLGKKSDSIDEVMAPSEDKRKFMFGKKDAMTWNKEQQVLDEGLNPMETDVAELSPDKRRPKFQFGRRLAPRPEELSAKVRSKFKLGKRSE